MIQVTTVVGQQKDTTAFAEKLLGEIFSRPFLLGLVVVVLVIVLIVIVYTALTGREVSFWPPRIGPRPPEKQQPPNVAPSHPAVVPPTSVPAIVTPTSSPRDMDSFVLAKARAVSDWLVSSLQYRITTIEWKLTVNADFGVSSVNTRWMQAIDRPVIALPFTFRSEDASPWNSFQDLSLSVTDSKGRKLPWLPTANNGVEKKVLVFLIDPLMPGEPAQEIVVRNTWPGGAKKLAEVPSNDSQRLILPQWATGEVSSVKVRLTLARLKDAAYEVSCVGHKDICRIPDDHDSYDAFFDLGASGARRDFVLNVTRTR